MRLRTILLGTLVLAAWSTPAYGESVSGDFNRDGLSDLAIGVPGEDIGGVADVGAVHIVYGAQTGPSAVTGHQVFTQGAGGVNDVAQTDDQFGWALAAGDFNGDGYADLAIGIPFEDVGAFADAGAVEIIYGSTDGLDPNGAKTDDFFADSTGVTAEDHFGWSLATANFGNGQQEDLAVGAPGEDAGMSEAGAVSIYYGQTAGLSSTSGPFFSLARTDIKGEAGASDRFGWSLAAANFGKSAQADLAVGVPGDDVGASGEAGAVNVLYGSSTGIRAAGNQRWSQNSPGIADSSEPNDGFGATVAAANFGKSSHADLAVGSPCESIGAVSCAGGVNVIYGTPSGLSASGDQFWSQNSLGIAETAGGAEGFGIALAAANFGKGSQADLAVGSDEKVGTVDYAGAVNVIYGTPTGLSASGDQLWNQNSPGIENDAETNDAFGRALGSGNFGHGRYADLAVGVPGEGLDDIGFSIGAVAIIYGTRAGLSADGDEFLRQGAFGFPETAETGDQFGWALGPRGSGLGALFLP